MKNLYLIPTDKPSRLLKTMPKGNLILSKSITSGSHWENQNIYITSDEEIKDWYLNTSSNTIHKSNRTEIFDYRKEYQVNFKIILTTDVDLIKDGIQPIADEFLEWFIKNPSCEEVKVRKNPKVNFIVKGKGVQNFNQGYKIIIPKEEPTILEEPKQEWKKNPKWGVRLNKDKLPDFTYVDSWYEGVLYKRNMLQLVYPNSPSFGDLKWKVFETKELAEKWIKNPIIPKENKQETLEEAAERLYPTTIDSFTNNGYDESIMERLRFKAGAKWQQERMYSEEDLLGAFEAGMMFIGEDKGSFKEWFEQFKKK